MRAVIAKLRWLWLWIFRRPEPSAPDSAVISPAATNEAPASRPQPQRQARADVTEFGEFYFRDTILDQLDRYFRILARMRHGDRDAYDLHSRVGAYVVPARSAEKRQFDIDALSPYFHRQRPSFGMVVYGAAPNYKKYDNEKSKTWQPYAIYWHKHKLGGAPLAVQPVAAGDVYIVTVYWDKLNTKRKGGVPTEFAAWLTPDGSVRILKVLTTEMVSIRSTHTKGGQRRTEGGTFNVPHRQWRIDPFFVQWAKDHNSTPESYLAALFIESVNTHEAAAMGGMIKVRARKANLSALFAVSVIRTPYFFRDRQVTVTARGTKRPIFHIVRTHERRVAGGRRVGVKTHFRGERAFLWQGYRIEITVPGWHHAHIADFDVGAIDSEAIDPNERR